ncbi:MAG: PKD domain-containing protein, partial [Patescibacteria group bacterium]
GATGGGNEGPGGDGTGTTTVAEAGSEFDVDNVLDELESITEDFLESYDDLLFVSQEVAFMQSIEMPLIVDVTEEDYSVGGFFEWIGGEISGSDEDFPDEYTLIEEDDIEEYNSELREGISSVQREVDTLSDTYEAAQELYDYLRSGAGSSSSLGFMEALIPVVEAYASTNGCATREYNELSGGELSEGLGVNIYDTDVSLVDDTICSQLDEITAAAASDYEESIDLLIDRTESLALLFEPDGSTPGTLTEINNKFDDLVQLLELSKTTVNNNTSRDVLAAINDLFTLVQNMEFVKAVLNASTLRGNAPLIVRFDALGSIDPSGKTVEDTAISWDLDGDGDFDDATGASTSYTYDGEIHPPGTYIVKLRVQSSDPNIAAGLAQTTVIVDPPSSVIHLTATAGGETTTLADFSKFPATNVENYKVTLNEATSAITFDASQSTDGAGNPLIHYEWDFGDGETVAGEGEATVQHLYGKPGRYVLTLTVTDSTGIQDRKITNVFVASPAARINVTPDSGQIGTSFTFSGAGSTTDVGTIVSYQWSAVLNGQNYDLDQSTGSSINVDFDQPGIYTVTLTVTDSSGKQDSTSVEVLVESQAPNATFEYSIPNPTDPGTYFFDATDSSDPDPQDVITFEWDFDGIEGEDYEVIDEEN